jgi:hypothetical protein
MVVLFLRDGFFCFFCKYEFGILLNTEYETVWYLVWIIINCLIFIVF